MPTEDRWVRSDRNGKWHRWNGFISEKSGFAGTYCGATLRFMDSSNETPRGSLCLRCNAVARKLGGFKDAD